jgi:hypothetical protein
MNPFMAFTLYVAARVFVQFLKNSPHDQQIISSLQFLGQAMQSLAKKNPLTQSFIAQLEIELEGTGIDLAFSGHSHLPLHNNFGQNLSETHAIPAQASIPAEYRDSPPCAAIFEVRDSQVHTPVDRNVFQPAGMTLSQEAAASVNAAGFTGHSTVGSSSKGGASAYQVPDRSIPNSRFPGSRGVGNMNIDLEFSPVETLSATNSKSDRSGKGSLSNGSAYTPPSIHDGASPPFLGSSSGASLGATSTAGTGGSPAAISGSLTPGLTPPAEHYHGSYSQSHHPSTSAFTQTTTSAFALPSYMPAEAHQGNIFDQTFVGGPSLQGGWDDMQMEVSGGVTGLTPIAETPAGWDGMAWNGYGSGR